MMEFSKFIADADVPSEHKCNYGKAVITEGFLYQVGSITDDLESLKRYALQYKPDNQVWMDDVIKDRIGNLYESANGKLDNLKVESDESMKQLEKMCPPDDTDIDFLKGFTSSGIERLGSAMEVASSVWDGIKKAKE